LAEADNRIGKFPPTFNDSPWATHIKKVLEGAGFAEIWVNPDMADQHTFVAVLGKPRANFINLRCTFFYFFCLYVALGFTTIFKDWSYKWIR